MTLHYPGSPGEQSVNATVAVIQAAINEARKQFGDDPAKAEMFIKLAYECLYCLKPGEVISVDSLVRDYAKLRIAPPSDVAALQARLKQYKA